MTATVVQLSFRAPRYHWPGMTGQGGSCPTERRVGASVCPCVCARCSTEAYAWVLPPRRHNH